MSNQIGFIGLGIMGKPMAKNLIEDGYDLLVYDIDEAVVQELVEAGAEKGDLSKIGQACNVIFTILPNGQVVQEVLFASHGVASTIKAGSIVIDMSSVSPNETKICAEKLAGLDVGFLDAPVSGGEPKAIDGTLAFMVGGEGGVFKQAAPYFESMGASATLTGGSGSGSITKLVNQIIVNMNIATVGDRKSVV